MAALSALQPGTGLRSQGIVEANRPGGHWGYRQDCFVADLALPARTIRAASTPDWIRQQDGRSLRRLTWRECAGLQGFPTGWRFTGTVASRFRQIGNAVQGDVAAALGAVLLSALSQERSARPRSAEWPAEFHRRVRYTAMEDRVNGAYRAAARQAWAS
ncbi:MAG: DNA cytosine methyltransferase [Pseudonocardiaceae bacterium]